MDVTVYDGPGWRTGWRCREDGGVLFATAVKYDRPGWRVRISDSQNRDGSGYVRPGRRSLLHSGVRQGVCAVVVLVAVFIQLLFGHGGRHNRVGELGVQRELVWYMCFSELL